MRRYGLIGFPLGHSRSASLFAERFASRATELSYELYPLMQIDELPALLEQVPDLGGLNVTSPYKELVLDYCHELSPEVRTLRAANVLHIERRDGIPYIEAYNTDVYGFAQSLSSLGLEVPDRALILGTGGAARAVQYALGGLGVETLLVSRTPQPGQLSYEALEEVLPDTHLVVNASPIGYDRSESPRLPYTLLTPRHLCYDLIYQPSETTFMRLARAQGAQAVNGLEMLRLQAEASWAIWHLTTSRGNAMP